MKSYVNKIKGNLSLYTTRKTSNLLDGRLLTNNNLFENSLFFW